MKNVSFMLWKKWNGHSGQPTSSAAKARPEGILRVLKAPPCRHRGPRAFSGLLMSRRLGFDSQHPDLRSPSNRLLECPSLSGRGLTQQAVTKQPSFCPRGPANSFKGAQQSGRGLFSRAGLGCCLSLGLTGVDGRPVKSVKRNVSFDCFSSAKAQGFWTLSFSPSQ